MLNTDSYLAIDTETTGPCFKHGCRAFAVSACDQDGNTYYFDAPVDPKLRIPLWSVRQKSKIKQLIKSANQLVFHNASFDLKALIYLDSKLEPILFSKPIHDTMILSHILDSKSPKGLKPLSIVHLDILDDDEEALTHIVKSIRYKARTKGWNIAESGHPHFPGIRGYMHKMDMWLPKAWANSQYFSPIEYNKDELLGVCKTYALLDAIRTSGLFYLFANNLNQEKESIAAYELQQKCIKPLLDMEEAGLHILPRKFKEVIKSYEEEADKHKNRMSFISNVDNFKANSNDHISTTLFEEFKFTPVRETSSSTDEKKVYSVDRATLSELLLQDNSLSGKRFLKSVVKYRNTNTALKYLKSYSRFKFKNHLYPNLNVVGTSTTRLSSKEPNGQNVSKGKESEEIDENGNPVIRYSLRSVFGPAKGKRWIAIDYDQLQIRIFAFLSKERSLIEAIQRGFDFHATVAQQLFEVEHPSKSQRKTAKFINFGLIFGAGKSKIDSLSGVPGTFERVRTLFPNVAEYIDRTVSEVRQKGYIRTASGYPLSVPRNKAYAGVNYRVQGTEGDIVKLALVNLHKYLYNTKKCKAKIILQVHDEFLIETSANFTQFPTKEVCKIMEDAGQTYGVECLAKPELITTNWSEGKEISIPKEGTQ